MSHLAFLSNRAYVFRGYLWSLDPGTAVEDGPGRWRSARIPLNAFISGPTAGGSMGPNITTPRAVYNTYWDQVCPPERRTHLRVNEIHEKHGIGKDSEGVEILNLWAKILSESQDPCIDVNDGHVFDYDTIGTSHILSVWPSLSQSPIVQRFAWSPLVLNAVARNVPALLPRSSHDPWNPASQPMPSISSSENSMLKGLVALHLRRGDYGYHCENMANYSVTFTSWNQFSHLPDRFTPPAGGGFGKTTPENLAIYLKHCWPDAEHVIQKLNEIRYSNGRGNLETIFILTNGDKIWLDDLKLQLSQDGWSNVVTSKDLRLTAGESEVDGAVDMQIAARAEVFIGNGFSSLTSNINMIRLAHHLPDSTIRFW
ncbi:hypothetical protein FRB96_006176 [Tulasnella sp. 330]|nr:hypothetical protein FRB96_006176 [Tulasnella sp. 330]KAG8883753.1 hypothetical protein FRB97_005927 [Tulasnella sp. 331]KAG8889186.1 hypothetical protein FRB98_005528 [Tulasnella sp. 332]